MQYPLKLKSSKEFIEELISAEYGRYEDACQARKENDIFFIKMNSYEVVAVDFLDRHKTIIEVRNDAEIKELYFALASGLIGIRGRARHANKLLDKIRSHVETLDPELVSRFRYQNGL